uniref:Uncharacterized protein n=1 Tax=Romanomermis culicivorax TaxID=13658 RepID=A0A915ILM2_ROMCU
MESALGEHMIKWVILEDDNNDQCIIGTDFLAHPDIHTILNFKDNYIEIQDLKLLLKVIPLVRPHTELFLNAANDNIVKEIPDAERVKFYDDKSDTFSQPEETKAEQVYTKTAMDCQVATPAADHDLTDHYPSPVDKWFPCHTDQQKWDLALNKMTVKT